MLKVTLPRQAAYPGTRVEAVPITILHTTCSHSRGAANEKTYLTAKFLLLVKVPVVVVTTTGPVVAPLGTTTVR